MPENGPAQSTSPNPRTPRRQIPAPSHSKLLNNGFERQPVPALCRRQQATPHRVRLQQVRSFPLRSDLPPQFNWNDHRGRFPGLITDDLDIRFRHNFSLPPRRFTHLAGQISYQTRPQKALPLNEVHGYGTRSRRNGLSQANSGWRFRCSAALNRMPHAWPMAASNTIFPDITPIRLNTDARASTARGESERVPTTVAMAFGASVQPFTNSAPRIGQSLYGGR